MMQRYWNLRRAFWLFVLWVLLVAAATSLPRQNDSGLDLRQLPIADWLNAGEITEIPWKVHVSDAWLRMDQRVEVAYSATIGAKDLNRTGSSHELFLMSRVSSSDGEWLNTADVSRHTIEKELPGKTEIQFRKRVFVQPGDYLLWVLLYDRQSNRHNLVKRRIRVSEIRNDPLPDAFSSVPLAEFPQTASSESGAYLFSSGELFLPVANKRPLQLELIATLSPPEQWTGRGRLIRSHNDNTASALTALSQIKLAHGSVSMAGLDLVRREVLFEERDFHAVNWPALLEGFKKADSPLISVTALEGRKGNGAFFREFLNQRLSATGGNEEHSALRVLIVVSGSMLFERGSDLEPLQYEGDCNCRIYHVRFRLNLNDVFDELQKFMKPFHPKTFNVITPRDFRKAIAEVLEELGNL
jgi:hypothetical protein